MYLTRFGPKKPYAVRIAGDAPARARFVTDSIASAILE